MVQLVLDINILISALAWRGPPFKVLNSCIEGNNILLESQELLKELVAVMSRPKFRFIPSEQKFEFVRNLIVISKIVHPQIRLSVVKDDPADNKVLECVVEGRADLIVTGDQHLLELEEFSKIKIVRAADALSLI